MGIRAKDHGMHLAGDVEGELRADAVHTSGSLRHTPLRIRNNRLNRKCRKGTRASACVGEGRDRETGARVTMEGNIKAPKEKPFPLSFLSSLSCASAKSSKSSRAPRRGPGASTQRRQREARAPKTLITLANCFRKWNNNSISPTGARACQLGRAHVDGRRGGSTRENAATG